MQILVAELIQADACGGGCCSENLLSATLCDHPLLVERFRVLSSRLCSHLEQLESLLGGVVHEYTLKYLLRHDLWKGQCSFDPTHCVPTNRDRQLTAGYYAQNSSGFNNHCRRVLLLVQDTCQRPMLG